MLCCLAGAAIAAGAALALNRRAVALLLAALALLALGAGVALAGEVERARLRQYEAMIHGSLCGVVERAAKCEDRLPVLHSGCAYKRGAAGALRI